jgi:hypothetical protein
MPPDLRLQDAKLPIRNSAHPGRTAIVEPEFHLLSPFASMHMRRLVGVATIKEETQPRHRS